MTQQKPSGVLKKMECRSCVQHVQDALYVLSGKWKIPIIVSLWYGKKRFSEIRREIPDITDRMLSKELKELETNSLIERCLSEEAPTTSTYSLTEYGKTIDTVIAALSHWGALHREMITRR